MRALRQQPRRRFRAGQQVAVQQSRTGRRRLRRVQRRHGTIELYFVEQNGEVITFTFNEPVCAGPAPGQGHSSYFIGVASTLSPKLIVAYAAVPGLLPIDVKARAGAAGDQSPATQVSGFASAGAFAYDVSQRQ
jgi:hypothetical protein